MNEEVSLFDALQKIDEWFEKGIQTYCLIHLFDNDKRAVLVENLRKHRPEFTIVDDGMSRAVFVWGNYVQVVINSIRKWGKINYTQVYSPTHAQNLVKELNYLYQGIFRFSYMEDHRDNVFVYLK
jgi:hypothetical protein